MNPRDAEQTYSRWRDVLERRHIIAAIRNLDAVSAVVQSPTEVVYLLFGNPLNLGDLLKRVRDNGKMPVQHTFVLDSAAIEAGLRTSHEFTPDAAEVLPAVAAPRVITRLREAHPGLRVVAGGLIADLKEVECLLAAGVDAVSISDPKFWIC